MTKKITYLADGKYIHHYIHEFNDKGQKIKEITY
ncbi:DUF2963 domain-containing protein [Candidatus Phytoplasma ziziphi]|nr:DUF2963 domain-containing protein [Candidatus Phytoplasma ziziphi]